MASPYPYTWTWFLLQLLILLYSTIPSLTLSEQCNPHDKKALLQLKKQLNNPTGLSSWDPHTDCCNWQGVTCDGIQNNRVNFLILSNLELRPHPLPFPSAISNLPFLNFLYIALIPNLTGPIPQSITNLTNLRHLFITNTLLSGTIPEYLSDLKNLETLDLSDSNLCGGIPDSLSHLPNLTQLNLEGNWLSGSIPQSFSKSLFSLSLSRNQLSGQIPASFGSLNLGFVDLSRNRLQGDASILFGPNKQPRMFNLSHNRLAFDIGKLRFSNSDTMKTLDLSNNAIYGKLPRGLTALKELREFNISYNSLCGEIPKGGNLQRFGVSSYVHNKCLCGSPLPSCKRF